MEFDVVKEYPPKGKLKQYRLESPINFNCFRCKKNKKSKLIATVESDSEKLICNGCYGLLVSKTGGKSLDA